MTSIRALVACVAVVFGAPAWAQTVPTGDLANIGATSVKAYGARGDGVTDDTAAFQAAVAAGLPVYAPAGTYVLSAQISRITATPWAPGLKIGGAGQERTVIDCRVPEISCLRSGSATANRFQLGGYIRDLTLKGAPGYPRQNGIELQAVYQFEVRNVHILGFSGDGARLTSSMGDADASNIVTFNNDRIESNAIGINSNYALGVVQPSFVRCENTFLNNNSVAGWRYIGLQGSISNCAFTENGVGFWAAYNGASNSEFSAVATTFENNAVSVRLDSLQGATWITTEIANTAAKSSLGVDLAHDGPGVVQGVQFYGTVFRISPVHTPFNGFRLGGRANLNGDINTLWEAFDAPGQTRYAVAAAGYGNTMGGYLSIQGGAGNGSQNVKAAGGRNENLALPLDGVAFVFSGPSRDFSIGGFAGGVDGRRLVISNTTGHTLTIDAEDPESAAANRIQTNGGADVTVRQGGTISLHYSAPRRRWVFESLG